MKCPLVNTDLCPGDLCEDYLSEVCPAKFQPKNLAFNSQIIRITKGHLINVLKDLKNSRRLLHFFKSLHGSDDIYLTGIDLNLNVSTKLIEDLIGERP